MYSCSEIRPRLIILSAAIFALSAASPSFAQPGFAQRHPRRAEVLGRDNRLNNQINLDRGQLGGHYEQLESEEQGIRMQEQAYARANGGHITGAEQKQLNQEEHQLAGQVHNDYRGVPAGTSMVPGALNPTVPFTAGGFNAGAPIISSGFNPGAAIMPGGYIPGAAMIPGGFAAGSNLVPSILNSVAPVLPAGFVSGAPIVPSGMNPAVMPISSAVSPNYNFKHKHPRRAEVLGRDYGLQQELNADRGRLGGQYGTLSREDAVIRQQEQFDARRDHGHITRGEQIQLNHEENHLQNQINRDLR